MTARATTTAVPYYSANQDVPTGIYRPAFTDATGIANGSNWAIHSSGAGLVSTGAGTQATGDINFPTTIDNTKPWRVAVLVEANSPSDGQLVECYLAAASGDANLGYRTIGGQLRGDGYLSLSMQTNPGGGFDAMPAIAGRRYWFILSSDGTQVTVGIIPDGHAGTNLVATGGAVSTVSVQAETAKTLAYNVASTGPAVTVFGAMTRLILKSKSVNNRIMAVYVAQNSIAGPLDQQIKPPAILQPTIGTDPNSLIRIPGTYTGKGPIDCVFIAHPNNSDEFGGSRYQDPDAGAAFASLVANGYITCSIRNGIDGSAINSSSSSPWGAPAGLAGRKALIDWIRTNIKGVRNFYWIGQSMGFMDGLNMIRFYPGLIKAMYGLSPATNLTYAYNSETFASTINTAYGISAITSVKDYDPNLSPALYAQTPIAISVGTADTTISKTNHTDLLKTRVEAQGGSVSVTSVAGAAHLNVAGLWDGAAIRSFFGAHT